MKIPMSRWTFLILSSVMLAMPWVALALRTAPGQGRPLIADVLSDFFIFEFAVIVWGVERALKARRLTPLLIGTGLPLLNALLLSLRLRGHGGDWQLLLLHLGLLLAMTVGMTLACLAIARLRPSGGRRSS